MPHTHHSTLEVHQLTTPWTGVCVPIGRSEETSATARPPAQATDTSEASDAPRCAAEPPTTRANVPAHVRKALTTRARDRCRDRPREPARNAQRPPVEEAPADAPEDAQEILDRERATQLSLEEEKRQIAAMHTWYRERRAAMDASRSDAEAMELENALQQSSDETTATEKRGDTERAEQHGATHASIASHFAEQKEREHTLQLDTQRAIEASLARRRVAIVDDDDDEPETLAANARLLSRWGFAKGDGVSDAGSGDADSGDASDSDSRQQTADGSEAGEPAHAPVERPPARLRAKQVAAAAELGLRSAGLSWLQEAGAAHAATSEPREDSKQPPPPREAPGRAEHDVPLIGEPPRHEREITLPPPPGFRWPEFAFIAFYEHSGEEREANARALDAPTCSVADRRSILPPSEKCWAFVGTVQAFVAMYPHPIPRQSNHMTCGWANWAGWRTWPLKILDGSMRHAAEELLWINCVGDRSWGEQPHSAHQHSVGPPTYIVYGHDHGAPSKTYCVWARNLPPVAPTDTVPRAQRWSELTVSGTAEQKTVLRSYTPRNVANATAATHARVVGGDTSEFGRPASQLCRGHAQWHEQLLHNFGLFAAHYAPTLTAAHLRLAERREALLMVPIAHSESGPCAMISLRGDDSLFAVTRNQTMTAEAQAEASVAFISGGQPTQYAARLDTFGHADAVVIVPWPRPPTVVLQSSQQRRDASAAGLSAAWCTMQALHDHAAYQPVGIAFQRIHILKEPGAHGAFQSGVWAEAKPLLKHRTARAWARQSDVGRGESTQAREAFMAVEATRGAELKRCFAALDIGDGVMLDVADSVRTAADYAGEIPFPPQGLPRYTDARLRLRKFVERPLALHTSWFARLPPQRVPPSFRQLSFTEMMRGWARRRCCAAMNKTADRDFECWEHGETSKARPKFECIGPGGAKNIPHADGIGAWNTFTVVWEFDETTRKYDKLDYARPGRTKWVLELLRKLFGIHCDDQLMSLVMEGVRWGIAAPMHVRIAPQLERLDSRTRGVGAAFKKLIDAGRYYKVRKLRRVHEQISPNGEGPFVIIPPYIIGIGGTDKVDNPNEKRVIGDASSPHEDQPVRERNHPHGEPDGPLLTSVNDMMGPAPGKTPRGVPLDPKVWPMPDPESKPRPRHMYNDVAVVSHMAEVGETYLAAIKDDGRHMFFQFEVSPEDERVCCFLAVLEMDVLDESGRHVLNSDGSRKTELWFVLIVATCMNMGSRNASKIAQRFTDRLLEGVSQQIDAWVAKVWLPQQTPALQRLLAERAEKLGPLHARPYCTSGYTDDYGLVCVGPELSAFATLIWRQCCKKVGYELSAKAGAGTVFDIIGGRIVLNGGFGCLPAAKHARAVHDTEQAIAGDISRERLESHNSFLVHVHDWLDLPQGMLKGLSAPLKRPGQPWENAVVTDVVGTKYKRVLEYLHTRCAASFWSGIDEAAELRANGIVEADGLVFAPRFASDSCSDVEHPYICGVAAGLYFRFPLAGEWRYRHITLTEACGTKLCFIVFERYFPHLELMGEGDATSGVAAAIGTASADDLQYLHGRSQQVEAYRKAEQRGWVTHCKGWANGLSDRGSRDRLHDMFEIARAYGMRLREVDIPQEGLDMMADVLRNTTSTRVEEAGDQGQWNPTANGGGAGMEPAPRGPAAGRAYSSDEAGDGPSHMQRMTDALREELRSSEKESTEVMRCTVAIATALGTTRPRPATNLAIIAAVNALARNLAPTANMGDDIAAEAKAAGAGTSTVKDWMRRIQHQLDVDRIRATPPRGTAAGEASSSTAAPSAIVGAGAAPPRRSPDDEPDARLCNARGQRAMRVDEMDVAHGLLEMAAGAPLPEKLVGAHRRSLRARASGGGAAPVGPAVGREYSSDVAGDGPPTTRRAPAPASYTSLPDAPIVNIYQGPAHGGDRLAECVWMAWMDPARGAFADAWVSHAERAAMAKHLGVILTLVSRRGFWDPGTIATESATQPGEWGYFGAKRREHGSGDTEAQIGAMLDAGAPDGPSRYLIRINSQLRDGAKCRAGGPRTANDNRGTGLPANVVMWSHGWMCVRPFVSIEPLRPGLTPAQRARRELLWDYDDSYWRAQRRAVAALQMPPVAPAATFAEGNRQLSALEWALLDSRQMGALESGFTRARRDQEDGDGPPPRREARAPAAVAPGDSSDEHAAAERQEGSDAWWDAHFFVGAPVWALVVPHPESETAARQPPHNEPRSSHGRFYPMSELRFCPARLLGSVAPETFSAERGRGLSIDGEWWAWIRGDESTSMRDSGGRQTYNCVTMHARHLLPRKEGDIAEWRPLWTLSDTPPPASEEAVRHEPQSEASPEYSATSDPDQPPFEYTPLPPPPSPAADDMGCAEQLTTCPLLAGLSTEAERASRSLEQTDRRDDVEAYLLVDQRPHAWVMTCPPGMFDAWVLPNARAGECYVFGPEARIRSYDDARAALRWTLAVLHGGPLPHPGATRPTDPFPGPPHWVPLRFSERYPAARTELPRRQLHSEQGPSDETEAERHARVHAARDSLKRMHADDEARRQAAWMCVRAGMEPPPAGPAAGRQFSSDEAGDGPSRELDASPAPLAAAPPPRAAVARLEDSPQQMASNAAGASSSEAAAPQTLRPGDVPSPAVAALRPAHEPHPRQSPRLAKRGGSTAEVDDEIDRCAPRDDAARSASPQPRTAAAARQQATQDIAARLAGDTSAYALCPGNEGQLRAMVAEAGSARDAGIPHGTARADEWGFKWVASFCKATGNLVMRPRAATTACDTLREVYFFVLALVWITQMMKPSSRRKRAGYEQAKPTSALLAMYGHRRVMRDCARHLPETGAARAVLKGICARYKQMWGDDAFVPERKQPFTTKHMRDMVFILATGAIASWPAALSMAMLVAFCHALSTGMRCDEWTSAFSGDTYARRSNYTWVDEQGGDLPNTPEVINSRYTGCLLRGRSSPSKCDRLNVDWGASDMWFRYDNTNPLNFAWRWQQWELEYPCPEHERHVWPAFSPSGDSVPFTSAKARACLNTLLLRAMSPVEAAKRSWHACRVTIATRLFAARGSKSGEIPRDEIEGVIQSVVRWKTVEAMRIYARMGRHAYADYVDLATNTDADAQIPDDLPECDPSGLMDELADTAAALEADERAAAKAAKAARRDAAGAARDADDARPAAGKKKRRPDPASGAPSSSAASASTERAMFDLGDGIAARDAGDESWCVVGQELKMCNTFWGIDNGLKSDCRVVGYIGKFAFADGTASAHTYVVECEGHCYPARHTAVRGALVDVAAKRRLSKAGAPRLVK